MAEPWEEQVAEAIVAALRGIQGGDGQSVGADGYWYKPDVVERTHAIDALGVLNEKYTTIYALAPFQVTSEESTTRGVEKVMTIDFLLARKHLKPDEVYRAQPPMRWAVQNRLWHDFERKILADVQLNGLVENVNFSEAVFAAESTYVPGWAIVVGQVLPTDLQDIEEEDED